MPLLWTNDDVTIPGTVVALHVATKPVADATVPDRFTHDLRCWAATAGRIRDAKWTRSKARHSDSSGEFWDWLNFVREPHRVTWIFGSRLSVSLTSLGVWKLLESGDWSIHRRPSAAQVKIREKRGQKDPKAAIPGLLVTESPPDALVMYHKAGWKLIWLSVENYYSTSSVMDAIASAQESYGAPTNDAPLANWLAFSQVVCDTVASLMTRLISWHKSQELGRFGFTVGGTAMAAFRHRFMYHHVYCPDEQDDRDYEREAYYPGRVEAFWVGEIRNRGYRPVERRRRSETLFGDWPSPPFYMLDARSFYGAIGAFCDVPYKCIESSSYVGNCAEPQSGRMVEYLASVTIKSTSECYPVRVGARLYFARGCFRTVLAGPELSRAYQRGHVIRWHWWRRYALGRVLGPYSCALWDERLDLQKKGDLAGAEFCKSLIARLHGKFLQRSQRWESRPKMYSPVAWDTWTEGSATTGEHRNYRAIGHDVEEEVDAGDKPYCFPAIAAYVTSWGRTWVEDWIRAAGKGNVLYVCTDAIIVTKEGKDRLQASVHYRPEDLGGLRLADSSEDICIRGVHDYTFAQREIVAGRAISVDRLHGEFTEGSITDTLGTVIYARKGTCVVSRKQQWSQEQRRPMQAIDDCGWCAPPEIFQ